MDGLGGPEPQYIKEALAKLGKRPDPDRLRREGKGKKRKAVNSRKTRSRGVG